MPGRAGDWARVKIFRGYVDGKSRKWNNEVEFTVSCSRTYIKVCACTITLKENAAKAGRDLILSFSLWEFVNRKSRFTPHICLSLRDIGSKPCNDALRNSSKNESAKAGSCRGCWWLNIAHRSQTVFASWQNSQSVAAWLSQGRWRPYGYDSVWCL